MLNCCGAEQAVDEADESLVRQAAYNLLERAVEYVAAAVRSAVIGFGHGYSLHEKRRLEQGTEFE
ncbi:MAG: hypothetical protein LBK66_00995 [Spirochaetaceae bacterium]|nr:hypothetical protein [Spirochaetaceae bacterium]